MTEVKVGQVWEDRDTRGGIRQVRVLEVSGNRVYVEGLRRSTVRLSNLRRRFRLIQDV